MLQSLKIQNFKGFKELTFPTLKRVNLITGKNNTGKTGVLEALLVVLARDWLNILPTAFRNCAGLGDQNENFWKWTFHNRELSRPIIVSAETDEYANFSIALSIRNPPQGYIQRMGHNDMCVSTLPQKSKKTQSMIPQPVLDLGVVPLPVRATDPQKDALDYDRVVLKAGGEEHIEALLRKIEPRLKTIRSIKPHGAPLLYVDVGLQEKIPAVHLGQGFIRLLSIYSEIIASGKKVLLIDEVENGLHYSVLTEIWRGILNASEQEGLQVFATTHSYECIRAAHAAFAETMAYDFALHRLEAVKGDITVTTYDKETLETSLASNFEIR